MGYMSKLYIVRKTNVKRTIRTVKNTTEIRRYAEQIASIDLFKTGGRPDCFYRETDCFIYAGDNNTRTIEDDYGDRLTEASALEVKGWLSACAVKGIWYDSFDLLNAMLEVLLKVYNNDDIVLLHYGY